MENKNFVVVGTPIPITAQLHDGAVNRKVTVKVLNTFGESIDSALLISGEEGFYFTNKINMPDLPWVSIVASVKGVDSLGQEYGKAAELFYSIPKPKPKEKVFRGALVQTRVMEKIFKGVLVETKNRAHD